jgi:dihydrodipicolinate synthase/N-acetylneuraminate lyase
MTIGSDALVTANDGEARPEHGGWRGIHAVMATPFQADLSLDEGGLRTNVAFLAESPVDAVICLGSEGEFYALSDAERRRVVEVTAEELGKRRPLVVGVSHPSGVQARALAEHAASVGADAVLATAPYFGQPRPPEVRAHFAMIAEAGLPVFVYNTPSRVGYGLAPLDIAAMLDVPGFIGIKQAAPDIGELVEVLAMLEGSDCLVIGGAESTIWPALMVGAVGNTATAASAIPAAFARIWRLAQEGNVAEGLHTYRLLAPLRQAYGVAGGQAAVVKRLMDRVGLAGGAPRPPSRSADATVDELLDVLVERLISEGLWNTVG